MNFASELIAQHTPESALHACNWVSTEHGCFRLSGKRGAAPSELRLRAERGEWRQWEIHGPNLTAPGAARVLSDNADLFGPVKLVAPRESAPYFRIDTQQDCETPAAGHFIPSAGDAAVMNLDANLAWAQAITTFASASGATAPGEVDAVKLVEEIKQSGWPASIDEGEVRIHLQQPGVFRQVSVQSSSQSGIKLACDLAQLDEFGEESLKAVTYLANVANARLPLVRYATDALAQPRVIRAEVNFGRALIPGAWLSTALLVIENAVALTARELEALRDPELAKLVLAAAAA